VGVNKSKKHRDILAAMRLQYCPVNLRGIGEKANSGAAFRMTKGVSDLN
jgi:hypothetical protein